MGGYGLVTRPWTRACQHDPEEDAVWDAGRLSQSLGLSAGPAATRREAQGAAPHGDQALLGPAPSAFGMLLSPVTSTPFSVKDILRLERERSCPAASPHPGMRKSSENFQYLRMDPEPRGSEVHNAGGGGGDRRLDGSEPPGGACEAVLEMDAERMAEPRE